MMQAVTVFVVMVEGVVRSGIDGTASKGVFVRGGDLRGRMCVESKGREAVGFFCASGRVRVGVWEREGKKVCVRRL